MKKADAYGRLAAGAMLFVAMLVAGILATHHPAHGQAGARPALTDKDNKQLQEMCENHAERNLEELANALDRLRTEMAAAKCSYEDLVGKLNDAQRAQLLGYLVGPFYEWEGASTPCAVRLRIVGDDVCTCSLRGASPDGKPETRNVYRLNLKTLQLLPPLPGQCVGTGIGDPEVSDCSEASALSTKDCSIVKPAGRKCKQLIEEMKKNQQR